MSDLFTGKIYCFDTNVLIDLRRRKYPADIFDTLWKNIEDEVARGAIITPREVYRELEKNDDELFKWVKNHSVMVQPPGQNQIQKATEILAKFPNLIDPTKETPDADPFVIALAMSQGATVVTSENHANPGARRPKIPDVCDHFGVKYLNILDYFREMKWKH